MPFTRRRWVTITVACGVLAACGSNPNAPHPGPLADGRWSGSGACLSIADSACNLTVGCGHGQFPRPTIRGDGTFDVDGTYRIEVGPVSIDPAPPAHFKGSLFGSTLTVTVVPTNGLPTATYSLMATERASCGIACV